MNGWISIHRKIQDNDLWLSEPFTKGQAWVDLLMLANHKPKVLLKRGIPITINRGEVGWSEEKLAERWKWSRGKVRRFIKYLKTVQQIEQQKSHTLSRIIIKNYDKYQENGTTDSTNNNNVNKEINISEQSSDNNSNMAWKKYNEDTHYEENSIDIDTGEEVSNLDEKKDKETKEKRKDIRHNIKTSYSIVGLPIPDAKQVNWQLSSYETLLDRGWTHKQITDTFINIVSSDLWKEKMQNGENPGYNTVEFFLRNKNPNKYVTD